MSYYQSPKKNNEQLKSLIWNLNYTQKDKVERICEELVAHTTINHLTVEGYMSRTGVEQKLLRITGTLPIVHKNATYNIPISFWIPYEFPDIPPMCYVIPMANMEIKERHKFVNRQGFIFHPYLSAWSPYNSNLIGLSANLQSVFGKDPPVFSRPPGGPGSWQNALKTYNRSKVVHSNEQYLKHQRQPHVSQSVSPPFVNTQPAAAFKWAPQVSHSYSQLGAAQSAYAQPLKGSSYSAPSNNSASTNSHVPSYDEAEVIKNQPAAGPGQPEATAHQKDVLASKGRKRLKAEVSKFHEIWVQEVNELRRLQYQLFCKHKAIEQEDKCLKQQVEELKKLKTELKSGNGKLEDWLQANSDKKPVDPLNVVQPGNVWSKQLIKAVAEDSAIDDTLYCVDRALGEDIIDVKTYLKQVRKLAREQFFKRALVERIQQCQSELQVISNGYVFYAN